MPKIAIVVHGGAGPDDSFIHENEQGYLDGLRTAADAGYAVLERGGSAVEAVEAAVRSLEDNPLFNAGKGAALTETGKVQMCTSMMDGKDQRYGAAAIIDRVRNPVSLARAIMEEGGILYLGNHEAVDFAREKGLELADDAYFITDHAREELLKTKQQEQEAQLKATQSGTVGAVACDRDGNIAAATSTGGTPNSREGRIGDSSMIGVGSFANNRTCAVSSTGDGEYAIQNVLAYSVSCAREYRDLDVRAACEYVIHERNKDTEGDLGVIAVDAEGNIGWAFNSERMHRGWRSEGEGPAKAKIWE